MKDLWLFWKVWDCRCRLVSYLEYFTSAVTIIENGYKKFKSFLDAREIGFQMFAWINLSRKPPW